MDTNNQLNNVPRKVVVNTSQPKVVLVKHQDVNNNAEISNEKLVEQPLTNNLVDEVLLTDDTSQIITTGLTEPELSNPNTDKIDILNNNIPKEENKVTSSVETNENTDIKNIAINAMASENAREQAQKEQNDVSIEGKELYNNGEYFAAPSMIKMYGEVLTDKDYVTNPAIARDEEIGKLILALITPDKSALLVGKPGIGKTALVEGLAYRINKGLVPDAIKGWKIIKINIPALLGKININGTEVNKLQLLISEIDKVEKTILFIDEVHLLVSHSGGQIDLDFANMLKPYLDRGRILMIGATTDKEYEEYILRDRAFVRRFIKIDIKELQGDDVVKVLMGTYPKFEKEMGVKFKYTIFQLERIFKWIVDNTTEYKRIYEVQNRYPDICLTIVSSAFSYAVFENSPYVTYSHLYLAMKNTNTIYNDAKDAAIEDFKVRFKNDLIKEGIDPNKI